LWAGCPFYTDYFDSCGISSSFTIIKELIIRNKGLDFPETIENNGQILGFWHNLLMQSITNYPFKEGDFFIGQQYIPIHFSLYLLRKIPLPL
jgi:hypothetical protein